MTQAPALDTVALRVGGMPTRTHPIRRLLRNPLGVVPIVILAVLAIVAVVAQWIAPMDPTYADLHSILSASNGDHLLGTDSAGRDVLSRLIVGAQATLLSAFLCAAVAIVVGLPSGIIAGYYGGWFDSASNWVVSITMSLPGLVILLTVRAAVGPSVWISMIVFGIILSPGYFRLTRTAVQSVRGELYVDAARVSGLGDVAIIGRHILTVVRAPIIIQTASVLTVSIAIQSGLEFLGLGDPAVPTWGVMLNDGFRNISSAPMLLVWPVLAIGLATGALVLLGNALRDALEDSEKVRRPKRKPGRPSLPQSTAAVRTVEAAEIPAVPAGANRLVTVKDLAIGYPKSDGTIAQVVQNVNLHVDRGEVLGIVGESGSGKSQTSFGILGLLPPEAIITSGTIEIDGIETVSAESEKVDQRLMGPLRGRRISYIPQEPMSNLDPAFTIGAQLVRPMVKTLGISKGEAKRRALELLNAVGIPNPERTFRAYPHEVSGGMAQRVLIAGALSCEPDLIVADEPTTALDVTVQAEVLDLIRGLQKRLGVAVLIVTHNFGVVADICDRVVVMQTGRLVEEGTVRGVLRDPQHPYTRELLGSTLQGKKPMTMLTREEDQA